MFSLVSASSDCETLTTFDKCTGGAGSVVEEQTDKEDIASEFQFTTDVANLSKRSIEVRQSWRLIIFCLGFRCCRVRHQTVLQFVICLVIVFTANGMASEWSYGIDVSDILRKTFFFQGEFQAIILSFENDTFTLQKRLTMHGRALQKASSSFKLE